MSASKKRQSGKKAPTGGTRESIFNPWKREDDRLKSIKRRYSKKDKEAFKMLMKSK